MRKKKKTLEWIWRRKKEEGENIVGDVTMHWQRGPLRQLIYGIATESWIISFENSWNVFSFSLFITHFFESQNHQNWITKHKSWSPNKMSSVGPISFGSWVMKTGSYHSKLTTSKQALSEKWLPSRGWNWNWEIGFDLASDLMWSPCTQYTE